MQLHSISIPTRKPVRRIGRGGKRGTYSGRGIKGQRARAGRRIRPQLRDIVKKIPKKRGYRFSAFREKPVGINLIVLERAYTIGETVSTHTLAEKTLIRKRGGKLPRVKILGGGSLTKKLIIEGCEVSASARKKIEQAGGIMQMHHE